MAGASLLLLFPPLLAEDAPAALAQQPEGQQQETRGGEQLRSEPCRRPRELLQKVHGNRQYMATVGAWQSLVHDNRQ